MENEKKKNTLLLAIIAVAVLLVAVGGAAFAYFAAQVGSGTTVNVTATTQSTDQLTFQAAAIVVGPATQANFGQGQGNQTGSGQATVTLKANTTASATYCYTAGLSVTSNDFVYTTAGETPELTVTATKNSTTVLNAYDITEMRTGTVSFPTALNGNTNTHTITASANGTTTDTWNVTVTFVNLNSDQSLQGAGEANNLDKAFSGSVVFTKVNCS